jgi:hypothetical protein
MLSGPVATPRARVVNHCPKIAVGVYGIEGHHCRKRGKAAWLTLAKRNPAPAG